MQSDQKIGLCLLIGLLGFAAALGFGRRERPVEIGGRRVELAAAEELAPVSEITAVPDEQRVESPETIELAPPSGRRREEGDLTAEQVSNDTHLMMLEKTAVARNRQPVRRIDDKRTSDF